MKISGMGERIKIGSENKGKEENKIRNRRIN
jgi:hypothetical protein